MGASTTHPLSKATLNRLNKTVALLGGLDSTQHLRIIEAFEFFAKGGKMRQLDPETEVNPSTETENSPLLKFYSYHINKIDGHYVGDECWQYFEFLFNILNNHN